MTTPFLKQIAQLFYDRYGAGVNRLAFVFPNRRSGLFFRHYLSEIATKPVFSPVILTINDLFLKLSSKQPADRIQLLFLFYEIYLRFGESDETFDDFVYWGEMLLNDFDDIDKYRVDAKRLFTNVTDLNHIEKEFSFLKPSQIQAIRSFWSSFQPKSDDANKLFFLRVWKLLYPIYTELRRTLAEEGLAYEGMIYREVIETLEAEQTGDSGIMDSLHYEKIIFVGLNALTHAEKELLKLLKAKGVADFYWDYVSDKIKDESNRASFFMQENLRLFPSTYALPEEAPVETQFEIIGIPSRIGQAKQLYPLLEALTDHRRMTSGEALKTAVVLPDEQLLLPVLNSIPEQIDRINVTLGYSLSGTPIASLMDYLQSLQKNIRRTDDDTQFYHRDVIAVLRHKYVAAAGTGKASAIIREITEHNRVYISASTLSVAPLFELLFSTPATARETSDYLTNLLKELNMQLSVEGNDETATSATLEQECIFHYYTMANRMRELTHKSQTDMSPDTYFRLLKQMTAFIKIPFRGEPLSGLQIMGVLETRVLDFENLIILSVNEGIFPAKNVANSFVPYHLRRGFGLPTHEHQESIWAYHFYRMIHRAKRVVMLYDTRTDGLQSGEVSRFVHQLKYLYKLPIQEKLSVYNISSSRIEPFVIDKDEEVMRALAAYLDDHNKRDNRAAKPCALSASAINLYLDCPLKFYFSVIQGINEEEAVSETLEHDTFGNLLHRVMELAYKPLCGKVVTADLLKLAAEDRNMTQTIRQAFADDFFHVKEPLPLVGQAYLYGEMIRKYACKILAYDRSLTPFTYVDSEKRFLSALEIAGGRRIRVKGFIDRIDRVGDALRIIDYKSGKPSSQTFDALEDLFDHEQKDRRKAILQVFFYAWAYAVENGEKRIQPTIYYTRNLFKSDAFDPNICRIEGKEKIVVDRFEDEMETFEENLRTCLNEMFDADRPFAPTSNTDHCAHCPFTGICGR
jgi:hypothetical protein